MASFTKLDTLVRDAILRYPLIFSTRWHVLKHLYVVIGNGYDWVDSPDGKILKSCGKAASKKKAIETFYSDIEEREVILKKDAADHQDECLKSYYEDRKNSLTLERLRRKFVLDNIDLLAKEHGDRNSIRKFSVEDIVAMLHEEYSEVFTVPDDAEISFKNGAIEVVNVLIPLLYKSEKAGTDHGFRDKLCVLRDKWCPHYADGVREILAALKEPL